MISVLNEESPIDRMLALIERNAPRLMRAGGGSLERECRAPSVPITPKMRLQIIRLHATGLYSYVHIAGVVGTTASGVRRILLEESIIPKNPRSKS